MIQNKVIPNQYLYSEIKHPIRKLDTPSLIIKPEGVQKSDRGGMEIVPNNISHTKGFISKYAGDKRNISDKRDKDIYSPISYDNSFDFNEIGKNHGSILPISFSWTIEG